MTRNLPIDSGVRRSGNTLMIPLNCLNCLWARSNNRTLGQFECDVTWRDLICFYFDFVCSYARRGYYSIVWWRGWNEEGGDVGVQDSFKIGRPRSRERKNFVRGWTEEWGSLKLDNFYGRPICLKSNIDVLMISESKIDGYFLTGNFVINRYSTSYRLNQHSNGGRILLSVKEAIPF